MSVSKRLNSAQIGLGELGMNRSQSAAILSHLKRGTPITPVQAFSRFGVLRLAARIAELKGAGHDIQSRMIKNKGKRYAAYWLA